MNFSYHSTLYRDWTLQFIHTLIKQTYYLNTTHYIPASLKWELRKITMYFRMQEKYWDTHIYICIYILWALNVVKYTLLRRVSTNTSVNGISTYHNEMIRQNVFFARGDLLSVWVSISWFVITITVKKEASMTTYELQTIL